MSRAQQDVTRLRELVALGAIAPARLQDAEQKIGDAQDDQILHRTLYGPLTVDQLTEDQLSQMVLAAKRRVARQSAKIERMQKLVEAGVLARGEVSPLEEELTSRRLTVQLAKSRAALLGELAEIARRELAVEQSEDAAGQVDLPVMEHFSGDGRFTPAELKSINRAFQKKFNKILPISANGETSLHRALGFDHRGRVDVAVNPDQREGVWLRSYLESNEIPYYAFRSAVHGRATGAHIHIGPGSTRLRVAD